jgi:hypothetical protein
MPELTSWISVIVGVEVDELRVVQVSGTQKFGCGHMDISGGDFEMHEIEF